MPARGVFFEWCPGPLSLLVWLDPASCSRLRVQLCLPNSSGYFHDVSLSGPPAFRPLSLLCFAPSLSAATVFPCSSRVALLYLVAGVLLYSFQIHSFRFVWSLFRRFFPTVVACWFPCVLWRVLGYGVGVGSFSNFCAVWFTPGLVLVFRGAVLPSLAFFLSGPYYFGR